MFPQKIFFWLALIVISCVQASENTGSVVSFLTMNVPRAGHTATLLSNGKVLIAGGCIAQGCENQLNSSAELYDPIEKTFTATSELNVARVGHHAILLPSGKVLILGGWAGDATTAIVELYNPEIGQFELAGAMLEPRDGFTATLLQDGHILITGGYNGAMKRLSSAEIYDPTTQTSKSVSPMSEPRMAHSASLLQNGRVLIVGGSKSRGNILSSTELFDPVTETFSVVGNLSTPRHKHAAVTLPDGDVLIIGGSGAGDFDEQYSSTELFNFKTLAFQTTATMREQRFKISDAVALLDNGNILVAGSNAQTELYNIAANSFSDVDGSLGQELSYSTATRLEDNLVLITGGYTNTIQITDKTWLYQAN
jgi:Kelch motif/Galactose oxidase, central domain